MTTTAISAKLSELENVIRAAGDSEVGDYLSNIRQSPNQLSSLRRALLKRPKRDETYSKRHSWCSQFRSQSGKWLSKKQVDDLVLITKHWGLKPKAIKLVWSVDPQDFCEGVALDSSIIRRCYNDLIRIRDDSSGRIVLLIVMSEKVEEAQQYIHAKKSIRNRSRTKKSAEDISLRNTEILTSSLRDLTKQLWGDLEEEEEKQQKRNNISLFSRYGWKWGRLKHVAITLSLGAAHTNKQWLRQYSPSPTASGLGAQPGRSLETDLDLDSFSAFPRYGSVPTTPQANTFPAALNLDLDSSSAFTNLPHIPPIANESFYQT
ncbi:hypothetical protein BDDG_12225 [Blastomyces dermatitidis ATCC 18188]|uniref:Uncharacterized protein n=1 Tax=Ajellomyces dermatitidis (strain ATCC 18188 / CBS 674.68) TaxID=653446 RepID=A0A0J9ENM2_AJEDA|nr:hypothetical protein BDDG_12225 [Blastomyces dermatitidis ATCC 18188]